MLVQPNPFRSEVIHSVHATQEDADNVARELEYQLPPEFEVSVEPFEVQGDSNDEEFDG